MLGSAKTNLPLLTLTSWVKEAPPFHDWARYDGDGLTPCSRSEVGCREEKGIAVYDSAAVDGQCEAEIESKFQDKAREEYCERYLPQEPLWWACCCPRPAIQAETKRSRLLDIAVILCFSGQESELWESIRKNTQLQTTTVEMTIVRAVEPITLLIMKMVPDL